MWFTCTNCLLALRYLKNTSEELAEGRSHKFWCVVLLTAATTQTAWRLLVPRHYAQWRFFALLFNRTARLLNFIDVLLSTRARQAHPATLAAQRQAIYPVGPLRAMLTASNTLLAFVHSCNTFLPLPFQAAFQAAYFALCVTIAAPSASRILGSSPCCPAPRTTTPRPRLTPPPWAPLNTSLHCPAALPTSPPCQPHPTAGASPSCGLLQQLAPPPPGFHPYLQQLCSTLDSSMQTFHSEPGPPGSGPPRHPCQQHADVVLVLFLHVLLVLLLPLFISYRIEQHAKWLYVRDVCASQQALQVASWAVDDADAAAAAVPCVPHWTDAVSVALLVLIAWQAAAEMHGLGPQMEICRQV